MVSENVRIFVDNFHHYIDQDRNTIVFVKSYALEMKRKSNMSEK